MNEILESIANGQRKQAIEQLKESDFGLDDLFEALVLDGLGLECVVVYRVAVSVGYIEVK